jgi:hypothetical protein
VVKPRIEDSASVITRRSPTMCAPPQSGARPLDMRWKPVINAFAITFSDRWPPLEPADRTRQKHPSGDGPRPGVTGVLSGGDHTSSQGSSLSASARSSANIKC